MSEIKHLKPCPFCACFEIYVEYEDGSEWVVGCTQCGMRGHGYPSKHKAILAWNKRVVRV